ncbi:trypsin eta-like [Belonocnema kinseyi]|uniref:trypsin eta-like n=1 Tax=Belonocnema kinseyi TaxID=2817044 RepID=UPI00143D84FB|nr:trypsin eta-like [Belonocnema kinseyi]
MSRAQLSVLILCTILSQGIISLSYDEEEMKSSSLIIRKKRLIDTRPKGNKPAKIEKVPYIVNLQRDGANQCGATILSEKIALTAAHCLRRKNATYTIISGASNIEKGTHHKVVKRIVNPDFHAPKFPNDLALLFVEPPFDLVHSPNRNISLHRGKLVPGTKGVFSGWGCTELTDTKVVFPEELRSIPVPIMSHEECRRAYPNNEITEKEICVFDKSGKESSCNGDSGGPFAIKNKLVGVMSWGGVSGGGEPDVFVNVAYPKYRKWIMSYLKDQSDDRSKKRKRT